MALVFASGGLASGCLSESAIIDERGGTVVSDDGRFSLRIPEGAVSHEVELAVSAAPCDTPYAVTACYVATPVGTAFNMPVAVTYELDEEMLELADPSALTLVVQRGFRRWTALPDPRVDPSLSYITASAIFLSSFTVYPYTPR